MTVAEAPRLKRFKSVAATIYELETPAMNQNLPAAASAIAQDYPDIWAGYAQLGAACAEAGNLDENTRRLVKLALAIGAASEGATHSHVRRALDSGIDPRDVKQVAMLAIPTLGFPRAVAALTWIEDITDPTTD